MTEEEQKREDDFLQFIGAAMNDLIKYGTGQELSFTVIIWELGEPDSTRFVSNADIEQQKAAFRNLSIALDNGQGRFHKPGEEPPPDPSVN